MLRILNYVIILTLLVSCSEQKKAELPGTSLKQLPQVHLIFDEAATEVDRAGEAPEGSIELGFASRVVRSRVKTLAEAKDKIQEWNGRSVDLLILGSGLPQRAYKELTLSKDNRLVVFWNSKEKPSENAVSVLVDWSSVGSFLKSFCNMKFSQKQGCSLEPKSFYSVFPSLKKGQNIVILSAMVGETAEQKALRVSIKWGEVFRYLFSLKSQGALSRPQNIGIDFKSGYLFFSTLPFEPQSADRKSVEILQKSWSLENL